MNPGPAGRYAAVHEARAELLEGEPARVAVFGLAERHLAGVIGCGRRKRSPAPVAVIQSR